MTGHNNVKAHNVSEEAMRVFKEFFPNPSVSMGTFGRKATFLLMMLSRVTNTRWASYTIYRDMHARCETILYSPTGLFHITHTRINEGNLSGVKAVIKSLFEKDKLCKKPYTQYVVHATTNAGSYQIEKTRYADNYNYQTCILYSLVVTPDESSGILSWLFKRKIPDLLRLKKVDLIYSDNKLHDSGPMGIDLLNAATQQ